MEAIAYFHICQNLIVSDCVINLKLAEFLVLDSTKLEGSATFYLKKIHILQETWDLVCELEIIQQENGRLKLVIVHYQFWTNGECILDVGESPYDHKIYHLYKSLDRKKEFIFKMVYWK